MKQSITSHGILWDPMGSHGITGHPMGYPMGSYGIPWDEIFSISKTVNYKEISKVFTRCPRPDIDDTVSILFFLVTVFELC